VHTSFHFRTNEPSQSHLLFSPPSNLHNMLCSLLFSPPPKVTMTFTHEQCRDRVVRLTRLRHVYATRYVVYATRLLYVLPSSSRACCGLCHFLDSVICNVMFNVKIVVVMVYIATYMYIYIYINITYTNMGRANTRETREREREREREMKRKRLCFCEGYYIYCFASIQV
jgi:hypothetical protein